MERMGLSKPLAVTTIDAAIVPFLPCLFALFGFIFEFGREKERESRLAFLNRFEQAADFVVGGHERDPAPLLSATAVVLRMQFDYDHGGVVTWITVVIGRDVDGDDFVVGLVVCGGHVGCWFGWGCGVRQGCQSTEREEAAGFLPKQAAV